MIGGVVAVAAIAVLLALSVAAIERSGGRSIEREYRTHLYRELDAARIRTAQVELMLDEVRSAALELSSPRDRDEHLLVSAPHLRAPGRAGTATEPPPIHDLALSIDALPEPLKSEVRALDGDEVQREYVETIQRELANGADAQQLHERLFGV